MIMQFKDMFECLLYGRKVRAIQWSPEYYLIYNAGEIQFMPDNTKISLAQLNAWRQLFTSWEIME